MSSPDPSPLADACRAAHDRGADVGVVDHVIRRVSNVYARSAERGHADQTVVLAFSNGGVYETNLRVSRVDTIEMPPDVAEAARYAVSRGVAPEVVLALLAALTGAVPLSEDYNRLTHVLSVERRADGSVHTYAASAPPQRVAPLNLPTERP